MNNTLIQRALTAHHDRVESDRKGRYEAAQNIAAGFIKTRLGVEVLPDSIQIESRGGDDRDQAFFQIEELFFELQFVAYDINAEPHHDLFLWIRGARYDANSLADIGRLIVLKFPQPDPTAAPEVATGA